MSPLEESLDDAILKLGRIASGLGPGSFGIFVDPLLGDPLGDQAVGMLHGCERQTLSIRHPDIPRDKQPYIAWIDGQAGNERLVSLSLNISMKEVVQGEGKPRHARSVCSWVFVKDGGGSRHARVQAGRHLERIAVLRNQRGRASLFRYYDPRVMERLPGIFNDRQMSALLGPVDSWAFIGRGGGLLALGPVESRPEESFRVEEGQRPKLERLGWVNQLLVQAGGWGINGGAELPARLDDALARAQLAGLSSERDCMVFASCALTLHPNFDRHPVFLHALERTRLGDVSFSNQVVALKPEQLSLVKEGKWAGSRLEGGSHDA